MNSEQDRRAHPRFRHARAGMLRAALRAAAWPLLLAASTAVPAQLGSAQWFSQASASAAQQPVASTLPVPAPAGTSVPGLVVSPQDALTAAQHSIYDLTRAAQAVMAARDAQSLAHQQTLGSAQGLVVDGMGDGGLQPTGQAYTDAAAPGDCASTNSCTWLNAALPIQGSSVGKTTVTVTQTAPKAILTWDSFNVGANTLLYFDQHLGTQADGNNNWVALNRVTAGTSPSQIFGQVRAEGSVYLINPNGIIFGGSSQIDVHSLLASTLPLYLPATADTLLPGDDPNYLQFSNNLFLNSGITAVGPDSSAGNILGLNSGQSVPLAANPVLPGNIALQPGATINVSKLGYALVAAPNVNNAGDIRATDGQVVLAAGVGVALKGTSDGSQDMQPILAGSIRDTANGNADATPVGTVTNSGLVEAVRGDIRLLGANVQQDGVLGASSSISRPGSIEISATDEQALDGSQERTGSATLASGSVTAVLPDGNGETTISTPAATQDFVPGSVSVTGGAVTLQGNGTDATGNALSGALIEAPGQNVSLSAIARNDSIVSASAIRDGSVVGRVYVDNGADIDVAGIADNQLDMSVNFVTIPRLGLNELADSPLQRSGILYGTSIIIDSRINGTRADGLQWVGTPLADLAGYVQQVKRDINRMLLNGGTINLAGNEVIQRAGSTLNLDAGFTHYVNSGKVPLATRLVTGTGAIVDISQADPNVLYAGFAGKTTDKSSRWNVSSLSVDPLATGGYDTETDYIEGGNAGKLNVFGATATFLDGTIDATTWAGRYQVANGNMPSGGAINFGPGTNNTLFNRVFPDTTAVLPARSYDVVNAAATLDSLVPGTFGATTLLPSVSLPVGNTANWRAWTPVSAGMIRSAGFSSVTIVADDPTQNNMGGEIVVQPGASLEVQPGGSIALTASYIDVEGTLQATAGNIALTSTGRTDQPGTTIDPAGAAPVAGDIVLGSAAVLDASGEWVNDAGLGQDQVTGGAFINGGSVSLQTLQSATRDPLTRAWIDLTGSIDMQSGSRIDVSSGGRILPSGQLAGGMQNPLGTGGSIALQTYVPVLLNFGDNGSSLLPTQNLPPHSGNLVLDGTLNGIGFSGGGTLTLRAPGIQVGGESSPAQPWNLVLPTSFFSQLGFNSVVLRAEYNALVANNTALNLQQTSFLPDLDLLRQLQTGQSLQSLPGAVTPGLRDPYYRRPLNFSMYSGDYVNWITSTFGSPNYAAAGIDGSNTLGTNASIVGDPGASITLGSDTQVTVLGSIVAHGGNITLTGDTGGGGYAQQPGVISTAYTSGSKSVWLGPDSLLDTSGIALFDPLATTRAADGTLLRVGRVLDGGTVTLTDDTGYVLAFACTDFDPACSTGRKATINVSGADAWLDLSSGVAAPGVATTAVDVGSNAGTVRLGAGSGLFFNGAIKALAGNANAEGGTLVVTPENPRIITSDFSTGASELDVFGHAVQMPLESITIDSATGKYDISTQVISATVPLQVGDTISGTPLPVLTPDWNEVDVSQGVLDFSATTLVGSGVSTLRLGSDPAMSSTPVPVVFTDATTLRLDRELSINTPILTATPPQTAVVTNDPVNGPTVTLVDVPIRVSLAAPYVSLTGYSFGANYTPPAASLRFGGSASLGVSASSAMDIGGQVRMDNWNDISLTSSGDIRFITPSTYAYLGDPANTALTIRVPGLLETTADITFTAAQIYPSTNQTFVIEDHPTYSSSYTVTFDSDGNEIDGDPSTPTMTRGTVTFRRFPSLGLPATPLSVGGTLIVDAQKIVQDGVLRAPGGQILLGLGTPTQELNQAWDAQALALLDYTSIDQYGDAVTQHITGTEDFKTFSVYKGVATEHPELEYSQTVPLIASDSVTFGADSFTSVSLGNQVIPYGTTVDGTNLRYNGSATSLARVAPSSPDLAGAPAKGIVSTAGTVDVQGGATIDLSGGGTLQAQEWVAGTGGTRDVLAAAYTSFSGATPVQLTQYADGRAVYAILPGYNLPLAPYDPELVRSPLIGRSVWLSGGNGLAPGYYTLLPARYATLPGAYRVVQDTSQIDFAPTRNTVLADGTLLMSGNYFDSLDGVQGVRDSAFLVQPASVWRQYSEYRLTDLNTYFSAASRIAQASWLPHDAGQFQVYADSMLNLDGQFLTTANGGQGAELDVAAPALQVLDGSGTPFAGYLHLDAATLDGYGFSRLVLGALSLRADGTDTLKPLASAIDISTAQTALTAGEIVAVAQSVPGSDGVRVESGSMISASGTASAARTLPIQVGVNPDSDVAGDSTVDYNGGGALLRVSSGASVAIARTDINDPDSGALRIGQNVQFSGNAVNLDSTGVMNIDPSTQFTTGALSLASGQITFDMSSSLTAPSGSLSIGQKLFDSFSGIGSLSLLSRSSIVFNGNVDLKTTNSLYLSAGTLETNGNNVTLAAPTLTLTNDLGAAAGTATTGSGSLRVVADQVNLGSGNVVVDRAAQVDVTGNTQVAGTATGTLDAGAAAMALHTPLLTTGTGDTTTLRTTGALAVDQIGIVPGGTATATSLGGELSLSGSSVSVNTDIAAPSGVVSLSSTGDIALGTQATLSAAGITRPVFDITQYTPGGAVELQSSNGGIAMAGGAVIDVSGGSGNARGGIIDVSASRGSVDLQGSIVGHGDATNGGADFRLDSQGALNLDGLADNLLAGGVSGAIDVTAGSGNLQLSAGHVLQARAVSLAASGGTGSTDTADGNVVIDGMIDASGNAGGNVDLYARGNLVVDGTIDAHGTAADQRGGTILLRTDAGGAPAAAVDSVYGYGLISAADSGAIRLGATSVLNVAGGTAGGLSGGVIRLRAPLVGDSNGNGDVNAYIASGATLTGAREVSLEAFATWNTDDASTGAQHFDGIVDPAGLYSATGTAQANAAHAAFYTQTLRDFVQNPGFLFASRFAGIAGFDARAGIALANGDAAVNGGDINVLDNWNLGAGTLGVDGLLTLDYRTNGYLAPVVEFRAAHDVAFAASVGDGFFQYVNPFGDGATDNSAAPLSTANNPLPFATASLDGYTRDANGNQATVDSTSFIVQAGNDIRIAGHEASVADPAVGSGRVVVAPTMLRTGTGYIDLAASRDFVLADTTAPGVVYTAGRIAANTNYGPADTPLVDTSAGLPVFLDSGPVHPEAAGNLSLSAGRDIVGIQTVVDTTGSITGSADTNLTQFWWPWMQQACIATDFGCDGSLAESAINFAMFDQGLMSVGGNVDVSAGGSIRDLSISLPVTWMQDTDSDGNPVLDRFGGGNLSVFAGGDIHSGNWFVARGTGYVRTLGSIDSDIVDSTGDTPYPVGTGIAVQDGTMNVVARGSIYIDGIHDPSYLFTGFDSLNYSATSAVHLAAMAGRVVLGNEALLPGEAYGTSSLNSSVLQNAYGYLLPSTLTVDAYSGNVLVATRGELYPSATGELSITAGGDIDLYSRTFENNTVLGLIDASPDLLPSPFNSVGYLVQHSFIQNGPNSKFELHLPVPLHQHDDQPLRIYSLGGSIFDSNPYTLVQGLVIVSPKVASIRAGKDIINLAFSGQNLFASDITTISAGRDIYDSPLAPANSVPFIEIGGQGTLDISAGRNVGPLTSTIDAYTYGYLPKAGPAYPGIRTIANEQDAWLPRTGANIDVEFGVAAGINYDAFAGKYINPDITLDATGLRSNTGTPDYSLDLVNFVTQYLADVAVRDGTPPPSSLTPAQAWSVFLGMPAAQREYFANRVFLAILDKVGQDYNDPKSAFHNEYARGYLAINLMYPPAQGYTANSLSGPNGAQTQVETGNFDMRGSVLQTLHGGDISVFGPGGSLLVGSASAPPTIPASGASAGVGPSTQGILTLEQGNIGIFTDASVLLAQSRIFTDQGGNLLIWSSNGDINAGKGAKTSTEVPPAEYTCDPDHFCLVDAKSQISGAGIAVLQTRTGAPAGSADLVAPRGTVDAGDAGIRVAGRLNVAAFHVANADNIQVGGAAVGVPTGAVDTAALGDANAAGAAAAKAAEAVSAARKSESAGGVLDVEVTDYGNADKSASQPESLPDCEADKKKGRRSPGC